SLSGSPRAHRRPSDADRGRARAPRDRDGPRQPAEPGSGPELGRARVPPLLGPPAGRGAGGASLPLGRARPPRAPPAARPSRVGAWLVVSAEPVGRFFSPGSLVGGGGRWISRRGRDLI